MALPGFPTSPQPLGDPRSLKDSWLSQQGSPSLGVCGDTVHRDICNHISPYDRSCGSSSSSCQCLCPDLPLAVPTEASCSVSGSSLSTLAIGSMLGFAHALSSGSKVLSSASEVVVALELRTRALHHLFVPLLGAVWLFSKD